MPIERFSETWNLTRQALASHQYLQQQQAAAQQAAQPAQPADTRSLAERLQDPETTEQALSEWLERSYGPTFQNVAQSALEGTLAGMRTTIPDFSKYEKRTRETLARLNVAPTQVTREIARYAYLIARGEESEQEAARATREPKPEQVATEPPTPQRDKPPEVELTSMQLEIAGRLGKTPEQYKEWLRKGAYQTMTDVPTERKDYGKPAAAPTE
ncbi:MAG: hypothetical protein GTO63_30250 [Anaerolineae bacterium]|nr:hypothetical protein [Anaerolineae bacterium]NIN98987.1 hypothetical protein [Anaerolineae bacterium]